MAFPTCTPPKCRESKKSAYQPLAFNQSSVLNVCNAAEGTVNGVKTTFLVDTGATLVGVSEPFAQKANLIGGRPTTFQTANGPAPGRVIPNVLVSIGSGYVSTSVGVGLNMNGEGAESLLGQSFLSRFDVTLTNDRMVLKAN